MLAVVKGWFRVLVTGDTEGSHATAKAAAALLGRETLKNRFVFDRHRNRSSNDARVFFRDISSYLQLCRCSQPHFPASR